MFVSLSIGHFLGVATSRYQNLHLGKWGILKKNSVKLYKPHRIYKPAIILDISDRIPDRFVGVVEDDPEYTIIGSHNGLTVAQGWFWNESMSISAAQGYFCDG